MPIPAPITTHFAILFSGVLLASMPLTGCGCLTTVAPGYILLAVGAAGLATNVPRFMGVAVLAWIAFAWLCGSAWLSDLFRIGDPIIGDGGTLYAFVRPAIGSVLFWSLLGAVGNCAAQHGRGDLKKCTDCLRIAYPVFSIGATLLLPTRPELGGGLTASYVVCGAAWIAWVSPALFLVFRVCRDYISVDGSTQPDTIHPWQYRLKTLFLAPLALWFLSTGFFPKLVTGDFCYVRIDKLLVHENGDVEIAASTRCSSGTTQRHRCLPGSGGGGGGSCGGFPAWPGCGSFESSFSLCPRQDTSDAKIVRDRLLVEQGRTYRVTPGKPLYFYRFKANDGTEYGSYVEVAPGSRLGLWW